MPFSSQAVDHSATKFDKIWAVTYNYFNEETNEIQDERVETWGTAYHYDAKMWIDEVIVAEPLIVIFEIKEYKGAVVTINLFTKKNIIYECLIYRIDHVDKVEQDPVIPNDIVSFLQHSNVTVVGTNIREKFRRLRDQNIIAIDETQVKVKEMAEMEGMVGESLFDLMSSKPDMEGMEEAYDYSEWHTEYLDGASVGFAILELHFAYGVATASIDRPGQA